MSKQTKASILDQVFTDILDYCNCRGLECHPFKIGWYNDIVNTRFHLPYRPDSLAFVIVSTPSMFELLFKPFVLSSSYQPKALDPIDQCMKESFSNIMQLFPALSVETIQDFELHANKCPKVLVQTAGHVSGAARYYQRQDVGGVDPWGDETEVFGVSVHPNFGGWFALRGVMIFKDVLAPDLVQKEPADCVPNREMRIDLLHRYNTAWRDWTFRDVTTFEIVEKYSDEQKKYFATPPRDRHALVSYLSRV